MKKIFAGLFNVTIICFAVSVNVKAQSNEKVVAMASSKDNRASNAGFNETVLANKSVSIAAVKDIMPPEKSLRVSRESLKATKATFRATEYFKTAFKDASNATWSVGKFGIFAYCTKADAKTIAVFNKKGFLVQTLDYYLPSKTPADIRATVQSSYPNDDIALTIKVTENATEFYIVQLEDQKTYKQLSVYNGVVQLVSNYDKAN